MARNNPFNQKPLRLRRIATGDVLLVLGGRRRVAAVQKLIGARNKLEDTIEQIDALFGDGFEANNWRPTQPHPAATRSGRHH